MQPLTVHVPSGTDYPIHFSELENLPDVMAGADLPLRQCLIVTDSNVAQLYLHRLTTALDRAACAHKAYILPPGEQTKSLEHLGELYNWALNAEKGLSLDRKTALLALGGGVIGDLAGFAAATLLRGLPLVQIPTTLLSQVDSSVGGKTGINHPTGKNLIGTFYPPRLVLSDTGLLRSLDDREYRSGLAELLKAGFISDRSLVNYLEDHQENILLHDENTLRPVLMKAIQIKADVVSRDEKESGLRAILNFGHTFAHALERLTGYTTFTHGEAVAFGMKAALHASGINNQDRSIQLIRHLIHHDPIPDFSTEEILATMAHDKKRDRDSIRLVLLNEIGNATLPEVVESERIIAAWRFAENQ